MFPLVSDEEEGLSIRSDDDAWDDEVETDHDTPTVQIPLYEDAPITLNESLLSVLTYAVRHNLNGNAIVDLLKLISLHCKPNHKLKPSLYFFKKHFSHLKAPSVLHHFCSDCYEPLSDAISPCPKAKEHKGKTVSSFFLEISLENQLQALFKRKGFFESLQQRFTRVKSGPHNIEDIYDSQLYKEQVENGFLSENNKFNFSLLWNTDGVPVFKSSKTSMWPIYFVINELPFKMRFKKENVLLGGIWYGSKPQPNLMLEPFTITLKKLWKGIQVEPHGLNAKVTSKGIVLGATADLPAKADFMGTHVGGSFSCTFCKIEGKSVKVREEIVEGPATTSSK